MDCDDNMCPLCRQLSALTNLRALMLYCEEGEDVRLAAQATSLTSLHLSISDEWSPYRDMAEYFTAADFSSLASLSAVKELDIRTADVPIEHMQAILQALLQVTCLSLPLSRRGEEHEYEHENEHEYEHEYGDQVLQSVGRLFELQRLSFVHINQPFSPSGVEHLSGLSCLTRLAFDETSASLELTTEHLRLMACIRSLEEVDLGIFDVTYGGLCWLSTMPRIKKVSVKRGLPDGVTRALSPSILCIK